MQTFSDVALGAYCLRKLHYRRQRLTAQSHSAQDARDLATSYSDLLTASVPASRLATSPENVASNLRRARDRYAAAWPSLLDSPTIDRVIEGPDCRGRLGKILDTDPPTATLVSSGQPPENGVWHPHAVKAVAAAKALAWESDRDVDRVFLEYPRYGVIRTVELTPPRIAAYRRTLEAIQSMGNPPGRTDNTRKCRSCEYQTDCGVQSRSLRSLLS